MTAKKNEYSNIQHVIYDATKELLLECKLGWGLILGCSNAVVAETPAENYMAALQAWREYGKY